jgi:TP901 family phage tail tape measure protein
MANTLQQLMVLLGVQSDGLVNGLNQAEQKVSSFAGKVTGVLAGISFAGISIGAVAASEKFESAFAQIQRSTGATEEKMKGLEASFANVYKQTAASSEAVANTLSVLSTRTQATGKDLENLALKTLKLAKTQNEDVTQIVPLVTRAFGDWSIATNKQAAELDYLRVVSQRTATPVAKLAEQIVYAGAPLRQLGYSFEQAAALIGKFEKEGVNTELVLGGMKAALQRFVKEGVTDTAGAWQKFIDGVKSGAITFQDVSRDVGAKRAVDLFKAIQEGRFDIQGMTADFQTLAEKGGQSIETMKMKVTKWTHEVETLVAAHKELVIGIGFALPVIQSMGGAFTSAFGAALPVIANVITALRFGLVGALSTVEAAVMASGIGALIALIGYGGYKIGESLQQKFAPGGNTQQYNPNDRWKFNGREMVPNSPRAGISPSIVDFVGGLGGGNAVAPPIDLDKLLSQFGIASMAQRKKDLEDAKVLYAEVVKEYGAGSEIALEALAKVQAATAALVPTLEAVKNHAQGLFKFGERGVDSAVLVESIRQADEELNKWVKDVAKAGGLQKYHAQTALEMDNAMRLLGESVENPLFKEDSRVQELLKGITNAALPVPQDVQDVSRALESFGINLKKFDIGEQERQFDVLGKALEAGTIDADTYNRAWLALVKSMDSAGVKLAPETIQEALKLEKQFGTQLRETQRAVDQFTRNLTNGFSRAIASSIVHWRGFGEAMRDMFSRLAEDLLTIMLEKLLMPLFASMASTLVNLFGGLGFGSLFGGGGIGTGWSAPLTTLNDGIVQNGRVITTHPDDYIIATKTPDTLGGGGIHIDMSGSTYHGVTADTVDMLAGGIVRKLRLAGLRA